MKPKKIDKLEEGLKVIRMDISGYPLAQDVVEGLTTMCDKINEIIDYLNSQGTSQPEGEKG